FGLAGIFAAFRGHTGRAAVSMLLAVLILWVSSTGIFSTYVIRSLEQDYPPVSIEQLPNANAIVVLGGFTNATGHGVRLVELNDAVDRLFHGMRLYRAGKAPRVILVGGAAAGHSPEADFMADLLSEFTIPRGNMLLENQSRNTRENGVNSVKIMQENGIKKILLVTSAYHMRRAKGVFVKLGMDVVPAATDYQVAEPDPSILDWLPGVDSLGMTTLGIKEYLGWWVYRFRGWVD
ncbi:MAG: YdcF family protein, partial [Arenicellales bacterium]